MQYLNRLNILNNLYGVSVARYCGERNEKLCLSSNLRMGGYHPNSTCNPRNPRSIVSSDQWFTFVVIGIASLSYQIQKMQKDSGFRMGSSLGTFSASLVQKEYKGGFAKE